MLENEKILKEILKENYYYKFYKNMKNKTKNELIEILKNTIKVNKILENELLNTNLNNLNHYDLNNLFLKSNDKSIIILKHLIIEKY